MVTPWCAESGLQESRKLGRREAADVLGLDPDVPPVPQPLRDVQVTAPAVPLLYTAVAVLKQRQEKLMPHPGAPPQAASPPATPSCAHCTAAHCTLRASTLEESQPGRHAAVASTALYPEARPWYHSAQFSRGAAGGDSQPASDSYDDDSVDGLARQYAAGMVHRAIGSGDTGSEDESDAGSSYTGSEDSQYEPEGVVYRAPSEQ